MWTIRVAVFAPLWTPLDYVHPEPLASGTRVRVPLGSRTVSGIVLNALPETTDLSETNLSKKPITQVIGDTPLITPDDGAFAEWISRYYHAPLGIVFQAMLPKALFEIKKRQKTHQTLFSQATKQHTVHLRDEQQSAVQAILAAQGRYQCFLLEGVTGSGKTEVYRTAAETVLAAGKQVLWLVPEIGLVHAMADRLLHNLNAPLALWHSGLSETLRARLWEYAAHSTTGVWLGTRSAVFLPLRNLGLIIVDEEHDLSYKQEHMPYYHGRDVAVYRAFRAKIPIILGSATPSLESVYKVNIGDYQRLSLHKRAQGSSLPKIRLVDLRAQRLTHGLSSALLEGIQNTLTEGNQALVFLNRRGFSPVYFCRNCGYRFLCSDCQVPLVHHKNPALLRCTQCQKQWRVPKLCPACQSSDLGTLGQGTEQIELALQQRFPDVSIVRIDKDSARTPKALHALLSAVHDKSASLLVGTQMVSKGHDFPHLTFVGIVNADHALFSADFRAIEHFGQQLLQVAGRPGRREQRGTVLLQTHFPDHPALCVLLHQGYSAFADTLLAERHAAGLPPYQGFILIEAQSRNASQSEASLITLRARLENTPFEITYVGPMPAPIAKIAKSWRYHLWLLAPRSVLQKLLAEGRDQHWWEAPKGVRWIIDVDAQQIL